MYVVMLCACGLPGILGVSCPVSERRKKKHDSTLEYAKFRDEILSKYDTEASVVKLFRRVLYYTGHTHTILSSQRCRVHERVRKMGTYSTLLNLTYSE